MGVGRPHRPIEPERRGSLQAVRGAAFALLARRDFTTGELRERLGIAAFDSTKPAEETISVDETARRLSICVGSVLRLIRERVLPAVQLMPSAPWQVPVAALDSEAIKIGVRRVIERRPRNFSVLQDEKTLKLPGF